MTSKKDLIRNYLTIYTDRFFTRKHVKDYSIRVLALHDIGENERQEFKRKMSWLKDNFNVISLQDAIEKKNLYKYKINIAITFDDGFKCFHSIIAQVLKELQLPCTFFICSGVIDLSGENADHFTWHNLKRKSKKFDYLTMTELEDLASNPLFEIGGHTKNHVDLGKSYFHQELEKEIRDDKKDLENMVGKAINFFAYPFGSVENISDQAEKVIKQSGYKLSFSILPSFYTGSTGVVGRDSLTLGESDEVWYAWLHGGYDFWSSLKHHLHKFN